MRVLVTGGRNYSDRGHVFETLSKIHSETPVTELIHGAASGADSLCGEWARANGVKETSVPAEWSKHGRSAGPKRNRKMLELEPDLLVSFPGGAGTRHMTSIAERAHVRVFFASQE
ncbi:hypothetical protein KOR42_23290 [Thalassoglobus neptunius]|uniref:YspA cpYpsA-related SLOG domain-containing protein n=1 Tax=Thalassoglobus neptunius TaxID=1938619 RepID=A0A5C5XAP0_9PLAN|nr:DUF2493 domain-containing protein [Thalassoglobus neptunius]TWT58942.1 hypothetical protein KOR42_23290 [Thalassoglobus neptunius]